MRAPWVRFRGESGATALRRRSLARRLAAGFTLVELMVVVVLISILALIATPSMRTARDDRAAFDYARRIQQMAHRARTRAAGRGAAHLLVAEPSGVRGRVLLFEALDNTPAASGGPVQVPSCKKPPQTVAGGQWAPVAAWAPGTVNNTARFVDGLDLDTIGINVDADIRATFRAYNADTPAFAMCIQPSGTTFLGIGGDASGAIGDMLARPPFNDFFEVIVTRRVGGAQAGLSRRVINASTAAPRIRSQ
ncbi:MAG: prepilin-type N-terminal cleavage/methylation domain-containing protein [Labilithrix sp.]|nr:prepilin-type N-terminal cleavage/methylation domain-containing protein [Labilithrix sp.]